MKKILPFLMLISMAQLAIAQTLPVTVSPSSLGSLTSSVQSTSLPTLLSPLNAVPTNLGTTSGLPSVKQLTLSQCTKPGGDSDASQANLPAASCDNLEGLQSSSFAP